MQAVILIGFGAGLASALLFASASTGTVLGVAVLFLLSPLPVAIAGLGWGPRAGILSAVAAAVIAGAIGNPRAAVFHGLAIGGPMAVMAYLALLSRPLAGTAAAPASQVSPFAPRLWFPIGQIVLIAALWAGLLTAAALFAIGPDTQALRAAVMSAIERMLTMPGIFGGSSGGLGRPLTETEKTSFAEIMLLSFPWAVASTWMLVALANVWIAGHVVRLSGQLPRPWPDLSALALPWPAVALLAAAIAASLLLDGMQGLVAGGLASALVFALVLVGLAVLHAITRAVPARPAILGFVYAALLVLAPFSTLLVAAIGLAEPLLRRRRRAQSSPGGPPTT